MAKSAYDLLDEMERDMSEYEPPTEKEISNVKDALYDLDDDIQLVENELDTIKGLHEDDKLTLTDLKDFLEDTLPGIILDIQKIRDRLY